MDSMDIEILSDGRIKIITDRFSPAVHSDADRFVKDTIKLAGGKMTAKSKSGQVHNHSHSHDHIHHSH